MNKVKVHADFKGLPGPTVIRTDMLRNPALTTDVCVGCVPCLDLCAISQDKHFSNTVSHPPTHSLTVYLLCNQSAAFNSVVAHSRGIRVVSVLRLKLC